MAQRLPGGNVRALRRSMVFAVPVAALGMLTSGIATGSSAPGNFSCLTADAAFHPVDNVILGTTGDDVLSGTDARDLILGYAGDDVLLGFGDDDLLCGGPGNDTLYGGAGNDGLRGLAGDDTLHGGTGDDFVKGGPGADTLNGDGGDDVIQGDGGADTLTGGRGDDLLRGGEDGDEIFGGRGEDVIFGDKGPDSMRGGADDDTLIGGPGDDVGRGGAGNDVLRGNSGNDRLYGNIGDDILRGGKGDDFLRGNAGDDLANGTTGVNDCVAEVELNCLAAVDDGFATLGNTLLEVGVAPSGFPAAKVTGSVLDNDSPPGMSIALVDTTGLMGDLTMNADGTFSFIPDAGYTGVTTFTYDATTGSASDTATVAITVGPDRAWYVDNTGVGLTDGRSDGPFATLAAASAASAPGDTIFVHTGDGTDTGQNAGIVLVDGQDLVGQGADLIIAPYGTLFPGTPATPPTVSASGGADTVTLAMGNSVAGLDLEVGGTGAAIDGTGANGTAAISDVTVTANSDGIDLNASTGTFTFTNVDVTSNGGTAFRINGGTVTVEFNGSLTQTGNSPAVNIFGGHSGVITFDPTTAITATNGTGLQFDNADGTYRFEGITTLNGGDSGIDILGGSSGSFTFGPNTSITDPTGTGFAVSGTGANNPGIVYTGTIQTSAGLTIDLDNIAGGPNEIRFDSIEPNAITGTGGGIRINGVGATVDLTAITGLSGPTGIDIDGGTGTFTFADIEVTNPSAGPGLDIDAGSSVVMFGSAGAVSQNQNLAAVTVDNGHDGMVIFEGTITATNGTGLQFDNADGTYRFEGITTLNGGDSGIDILGGSSGSFTFRPNTSITDPTGLGIQVADFDAPGRIDFDGSMTVNGGTGLIRVDTTATGTTINFNRIGANTLGASNTGGSGIEIQGADGDITVAIPTTIDNAGFSAIFTGLGSGTYSFMDTVITNQQTGNAGVDIISNASTLNFTNLDITTDGTGDAFGRVGFLALPGHIVNLYGTNNITSTGGPAVAINGTTSFDITLNNVTSTNSTFVGPTGQNGVSVFFAGTGTLAVTGTTTIDGPGDEGIVIDDVDGSITFANVAIANTGTDGISGGVVLGAPAVVSVNGGTIDNTGQDGVQIGSVASSGVLNLNNTTFTNITGLIARFTGSTLSGSGNVAVPFSCFDGGGNTGAVLFNGGADSCP